MSGENTILSALLDYYSDKASAEASAVVATTFGLFVILTVEGHRPCTFVIYWFLWFAGLYFLMGFGYWAHHANRTKRMLTGVCAPSSKTNPIDKQIEDGVRNEWKKTFLRNLYYKLKLGAELSLRQWVCEREKELVIKLGDVLHIIYFIFGLGLSFVFFRGETCSLWGIIFSLVLSFLFCLDGFSIVLHRRFRRGK